MCGSKMNVNGISGSYDPTWECTLPQITMRFQKFGWSVALALLGGMALLAGSAQAPPQADALTLRIIVASSAAEAQRLRDRVSRGEDFGAVATAESVDPSRANGGLLGQVAIATLRPELRNALRGVSPGQLSAIVAVPTGFAFLRVEPQGGPAVAPNTAAMGALLATGSVKYVLDVGGLPEAEAVLREFPKPPDWDLDPATICKARTDSMTAALRLFEDFFSPRMAAIRTTRPPSEVMQAHLGLAQLLAYQGDLDRALPQFEAAYQLALTSVPQAALTLEETLGLAYLHKAGADSGTYHAPGDLCLIPTRAGLAFSKPGDAAKAVAHFRRYLQQRPDDLEVRWLLNIASMMLGTYPAGVPAPHLIPPAAFASADDVGRFADVAPAAGLDVFATAGGVVVDDLRGNGRLDVVTSNFYSCGPMHYFGNNGDGTFTERTEAAGLSTQLGGLNMVQADYNNDRCTDLLVLRGGWEVAQRNSLLRNNCDGTFTDVTADAGLAAPATATQTAAWTDINNDSFLDLFVGNEDSTAQLFLNKGGMRFENISRGSGVDRLSFAKAVVAGDYDNDGYQDLYVSNYDGDNILYRNNRDNTFADTTHAAGVPGPGRGFGAWFFDYDNDGWLDLFATSYFMSTDETARTYLSLPHNAPTLKLYRNEGSGTFRDVTASVGLEKVFMPMGANFGDVDNDGFLDIYLGMGTPSFGAIAPHVLLRNRAGKSFVDITTSSGTGELHKGHGIAFADLDHDGDEDIVAEIGGATPGDSHALRLFENPGQGHDWVAVKLVGAKSNRAAIGARLTVTVENEGGGLSSIHRAVSSGGSFGASPLEQHIGLGKAARIKALDIWWPASDTRQHFADLEKNRAFEITELGTVPRPIERRPVRLGGAKRVAP
jgi:hypothetical protein